jgi:hypothetical protein
LAKKKKGEKGEKPELFVFFALLVTSLPFKRSLQDDLWRYSGAAKQLHSRSVRTRDDDVAIALRGALRRLRRQEDHVFFDLIDRDGDLRTARAAWGEGAAVEANLRARGEARSENRQVGDTEDPDAGRTHSGY